MDRSGSAQAGDRGAQYGAHDADDVNEVRDAFDAYMGYGAHDTRDPQVPPQRGARRRTGGDEDQPSRVAPGRQTAAATRKAKSPQGSKESKGAEKAKGRSSLFGAITAHPVVVTTAVVLVAGGVLLVTSGFLSGSQSPDSPAATNVVHGFKMALAAPGADPVGYDFSYPTPTVADLNTDSIYVVGTTLQSSSGEIVAWDGSSLPSAGDCREALASGAVRELNIWPGRLVCFMDKNNNPGYLTETGKDAKSITVDLAHLR